MDEACVIMWHERGTLPTDVQPVRRLAYEDFGYGYSRNNMTVYELDNGQYMTAYLVGCSCVTEEDAELTFYPTAQTALDRFNDWVRFWKRMQHDDGY